MSSPSSTVDEQTGRSEIENVLTPTEVESDKVSEAVVDQNCEQQEGPDLGLSSDEESDAESGSSGDTFTDDSVVDWLATESFEGMDSDEVRKSFEQHSVDYDAIVQDPQACRKFLQSVRRDLARRGKSVMSAELMDRLDDVLCAEKPSTDTAPHTTDAKDQLDSDEDTTQDKDIHVDSGIEQDVPEIIDVVQTAVDTASTQLQDVQAAGEQEPTDALTEETESQVIVLAEQGDLNEEKPAEDEPNVPSSETEKISVEIDSTESESVLGSQTGESQTDVHVADTEKHSDREENDGCAQESDEEVVLDVDCYVAKDVSPQAGVNTTAECADDDSDRSHNCSMYRDSDTSQGVPSSVDEERESEHCCSSTKNEAVTQQENNGCDEECGSEQQVRQTSDQECQGEQNTSRTDDNEPVDAENDEIESESVVFEDYLPYQYVVVGFPGYKPDIFAIETPCVTKVPARFADMISEGYVVRMMRIASFEEEKIRYSRNKPVARQLVNMTIEPTDRKEPFLLVRLTGEDKFRIMTTRYAEKIGAEKSDTPVTIKGFQVSTIHFAIDLEDLEEHWLYKPSTRKNENGETVVVWQQFWMSDSRELCVRQPDQ